MPHSNHPQQELVFVVFDGARPEIDRRLDQLLEELRETRAWTLGPPERVELEGESHPGGALKIYAARPDGQAPLEYEVDRAHLDEVTLLVERLAHLSKERGLEIDFELDGETVGALHHGRMSTDLEQGLLGEWRRVLDAARS